MITGTALLLVILITLICIILACSVLKWHPFPVLLVMALVLGLLTGIPGNRVIKLVIDGGSSVFGGIGIIIALGSILGNILEKTGAAISLARGIIALTGKRKILPGMGILGAVIGIPVFCDSGFVILSNLTKTLALQTGLPAGSLSLALASGLYTTHVLIPPTPGPLAAAGNLQMGEQLGWVILLGLLVSIPAIIIGVIQAAKYKIKQQDRPSEEITVNERAIPSFINALIPLLLPVLLIAMGSLLPLLPISAQSKEGIAFFCNPNIALLIAVILALVLLARPAHKEWTGWIQHALMQAGPIILITIAGGSLGAVLKATALSDFFEGMTNNPELPAMWLFPVSFLLAAGLKTSQGSSTAAMVIASSMIASLLPGAGMESPVQKALLVLCIGAGAMTVSHANDSYFWVISQYAQIPPRDMFRHFSLSTFWMGLSVLLSSMLLAVILG